VPLSERLSNPIAHIVRIPYQVGAIAKLIAEGKRVTVLSFMEQANIINLLSARFTGHKAIISQRINPILQYHGKGVLGKIITNASKILYPRAATIIAVAEELKEILVNEYNIPQGKIEVIHNPVDLAYLSREAKADVKCTLPPSFLLHVGRLKVDVKRQDLLIEAFSLLTQKYPDLHLLFIGSGPDEQKIDSLISDSNLQDRIHLLGWQDNPWAYMSRAKALVLCSRYEGWPNVLVEAMACGCPVVAVDCKTGPKEILLDGKYGVLVREHSPRSLAEGISRLLDDPESYSLYKEAALKRAGQFGIEKISRQYIEVIKRCLS